MTLSALCSVLHSIEVSEAVLRSVQRGKQTQSSDMKQPNCLGLSYLRAELQSFAYIAAHTRALT